MDKDQAGDRAAKKSGGLIKRDLLPGFQDRRVCMGEPSFVASVLVLTLGAAFDLPTSKAGAEWSFSS